MKCRKTALIPKRTPDITGFEGVLYPENEMRSIFIPKFSVVLECRKRPNTRLCRVLCMSGQRQLYPLLYPACKYAHPKALQDMVAETIWKT